MKLLVVVLVALGLTGSCRGLIDRLYCGLDNCYDLLEISRDATQTDIRRAYRKQAMRYHPDKNKEKGARQKFEKMTTAYEVLKDEGERSNYDYMLDHPDEVYGHYYRYYRRRTPSIDVRLVIAIVIIAVSFFQYISWTNSYSMAISYALSNPGYHARAKEFAESNGFLDKLNSLKVGKDISKADLKFAERKILLKVLEENLNITGGYGRPKITDILLFQLLLLPYTVTKYLVWYGRWVWRFNIQKEPYGPEEREYLTRKALKLSKQKWEALNPEQREEALVRELWVWANLVEWRKEQEEERRAATAQNTKYKMYRRYLKNKGKGRTTMELYDD